MKNHSKIPDSLAIRYYLNVYKDRIDEIFEKSTVDKLKRLYDSRQAVPDAQASEDKKLLEIVLGVENYQNCG